MVVGRRDPDRNTTIFEVITGDYGTKYLSTLPKEIYGSSMVMHNGSMLLCGGSNNRQKCYKLSHNLWKEHSALNRERINHSAVATQTATFLFGGSRDARTYEYLPKDSNTWLMADMYPKM